MSAVEPLGADRWSGEVTLATVLAPVLERWRVLLVAVLGFGALGVVVTSVRPTEYDASVVLATVSSTPSLQLGGAAALLAGGALAQGGFQPNPTLIAGLLESRRVLHAVASAPAPNGGRTIDRAFDKPVSTEDEVPAMRRLVRTSVDKETGLVTLGVTLRDSATARRMIDDIVRETTHMFVATAKAQATQLRLAQEARVDSAGRQLRRAQAALQAFHSANRGYESYSSNTLTETSLSRDVTLAENVYTRAVGDREAAVAKELEETPVVVVVDSLPNALPRAPRYRGLVALLSVFVGFVAGLAWIFVTEAFHRQTALPTADGERLRAAVARVPLIRRRTRRREHLDQ